MSITDELRKYVADNRAVYITPFAAKCLIGIADSIDAEHEKAMNRAGQLLADAEKDRDYNYANWQECKQKVLQHNITIDELDARIECLEDELSHSIELPKDADGMPIHVGDKLRFNNGMIVEVRYLKIDSDGTSVCVLATNGGGDFYAITDKAHHYHEPTVEDVLREFGDWYAHTRGGCDEGGIIAEYAARLMLKED